MYVLSDYIRAFVTEREEKAFFFFQQDLANHDYMKASESSKNMSPAIIILLKFVAELYMAFVKDTRKVKKEQQCASCENG